MAVDWKKSADDLRARIEANDAALNKSLGIPAPPAYSSPAPSYASTAPSYSVPAPAYNGSASVIGNVSGSQDIGKSYQDIYNSTRNDSNMYNQLNTWSDNKGSVYDTTKMSPQQIYALSLSKNNNPNAAAILKGMGLDMNGNPTSAPSVPAPMAPNTSKPWENSGFGATFTPQGSSVTPTNVPAPQSMPTMNTGQGSAPSMPSSPVQNASANVPAPAMSAPVSAPAPAPAPTPAPQSNVPAPGNGQLSADQIRAEVQARLDKQRAALAGAVDYTKTGLKNAYDYTQGIQKDNRVLEDARFNDTNNPFSGATGYRAAMMDRNRSIADTAQNKDYEANVAAADKRLADFNSLAPEQADAMYNDLMKIERDYGLQAGQITGNLNGQRTLAGSAQDFGQMDANRKYGLDAQGQAFNQGLAQQQFGYQQQRDKVSDGQFAQQQARQSKIDNWNAYLQSVGLTGNLGSGAKADWGLLGGTGGEPTIEAKTSLLQQEGLKLNNEMSKLQLANYPQEQQLKFKQLQAQIADIGKAPYRSAEDIDFDKVKLDTAKEQLKQLKDKQPSSNGNFNLDDYKGYINQNFVTEKSDPVTGEKTRSFDSGGARKYIIGLGLPDDQTDQMLKLYGLPTN